MFLLWSSLTISLRISRNCFIMVCSYPTPWLWWLVGMICLNKSLWFQNCTVCLMEDFVSNAVRGFLSLFPVFSIVKVQWLDTVTALLNNLWKGQKNEAIQDCTFTLGGSWMMTFWIVTSFHCREYLELKLLIPLRRCIIESYDISQYFWEKKYEPISLT